MIHHSSPVSGVACYADCYVATAGYDNQIILWDMQTGQSLGRVWHDHLANQCAFSADGRRLVSASSDYTARVWSIPDLRLQTVLGDHRDDVEMAIFHPTEDLIATASRDHAVRIFSGEGQLLHRFDGHAADVLSVEWFSDTTDVISCGDDGTIRRWSLNSGHQVESFDLGGVETDTVVVSPNGTIYAGTDNGHIVSLAGGERSSIEAHAAGIKRLAYSATRQLLVSLSYDRNVKVWSAASGELEIVASTVMPADVWARACTFGPGTTLFFGTFGERYRQYNYYTRQWSEPVPPTGGVNAVCVMDGLRYSIGDAGHMCRDGAITRELGSLCNFLVACRDRILTGGQMGTLFDALEGSVVFQHRSPLNCGVAYEVNNELRVMIGCYTGEGLVFKLTSSKIELVDQIQIHNNAVKGVAYSGGTIFSVCADTSCAWIDTATHAVRQRLDGAHGRIANGCVGLPEGRFVSVSRDRLLRLWDGFSARTVETLHQNSIKCVAADNSGRFIASGSYGGHFGILDLATNRWPRFERLSSAGVSSVCFDETRHCFLASCYDGRIYQIGLPAND